MCATTIGRQRCAGIARQQYLAWRLWRKQELFHSTPFYSVREWTLELEFLLGTNYWKLTLWNKKGHQVCWNSSSTASLKDTKNFNFSFKNDWVHWEEKLLSVIGRGLKVVGCTKDFWSACNSLSTASVYASLFMIGCPRNVSAKPKKRKKMTMDKKKKEILTSLVYNKIKQKEGQSTEIWWA